MGTVQVFDSERMQEIEDTSVVDGHIDGSGHLILVQHDGTEIDAGSALATIPVASETVQGIVELATTAETTTGTDTERAVTPAGVAAAIGAIPAVPDASTTVEGIVELATSAETITGTDTVRATTPAGVAAAVQSQVPTATDTTQGRVELATNAETTTGTDTTRATTPAGVAAAITANAAAAVPSANETTQGKVELATNAEFAAGTDTSRASTPANVANAFGGVFPRIASGVVAITPVANTPTLGHVTFPVGRFTSNPAVTVSASTSVPGSTVIECAAANVNTSGFDAYIYRTNTTSTSVFWIAVQT